MQGEPTNVRCPWDTGVVVARTPFVVSIAACLLVGCGDRSAPSPSPPDVEAEPPTGAVVTGTATRVTDGDTIRVDIGESRTERVRLIGIDAPETDHPDPARRCLGDEAARTAEELLPADTAVRLETDPTQDVRDRHDRLLAYVHPRGESVSVNETLLRRGAATVYVYRGHPFARHAAFVRAEREARDARRGLWSACPVTG